MKPKLSLTDMGMKQQLTKPKPWQCLKPKPEPLRDLEAEAEARASKKLEAEATAYN